MPEVSPQYGETVGSDGAPLDVIAPHDRGVDPGVLEGQYEIPSGRLDTTPEVYTEYSEDRYRWTVAAADRIRDLENRQ